MESRGKTVADFDLFQNVFRSTIRAESLRSRKDRRDSARMVNRFMHGTVSIGVDNLPTENIFYSPDRVMHKDSKERSTGVKSPMISLQQNNSDKIWDLCCEQIILFFHTLFSVLMGRRAKRVTRSRARNARQKKKILFGTLQLTTRYKP